VDKDYLTCDVRLDRTPREMPAMIANQPEMNPLAKASIALCAREPEELEPLAAVLASLGCVVRFAENAEELTELLEGETVDVVLAHICPSRKEFLDLLGQQELPPVIPLLCHADEHLYLETLRRGAFDCVPLPAQKDELRRVLTLALRSKGKSPSVPTPC
jgi:DNA-binding NtrC family response regulator